MDGLYLAGITSPLADASGYLGPLFGHGVRRRPRRAHGRGEALERTRRGDTDPVDRAQALGEANDGVRAIVAASCRSSTRARLTAWRADVDGAAVTRRSALDPLGAFVPGDRPQPGRRHGRGGARRRVVRRSRTRSTRSGCARWSTPGLYGFAGAHAATAETLAARCTPSEGARVWTCRLRAGRTFADGAALDAGDVLATFRAPGRRHRGDPLRGELPATAFAAWDGLFGGPLPGAPAP